MIIEFHKMPIRRRWIGFDRSKSKLLVDSLRVKFLTFWLFNYHLVVVWQTRKT